MKNTAIANKYIARCHKTLMSWCAPLSDWHCVQIDDMAEVGWIAGNGMGHATCELCGCEKVRFVHVMRHERYFEDINVGCVCAGVMEGDVLAARERERKMTNRAKRKRNYLKRRWESNYNGRHILRYKNQWVVIWLLHGQYGVICGNKSASDYKGKRITNFLTAVHAAFDLVDPPVGGGRL